MTSAIEYLSKPLPTSMADEWYDFAGTDHFWMEWRLAVVGRATQNLLPMKPALPTFRSLEIGCGNGSFRQQMESHFGLTVDACDLNEKALKMAQGGRGRLLLYNIFDRHPGLLAAYSTVFLMDVIEHIDNARDFVNAAAAHARPGGLIVINVPALPILYSNYDRVAGHLRRYSRAELRALLASCGIELVSMTSWGFLMIPVLFIRKLVGPMIKGSQTIKSGFVPSSKFVDLLLRWLMRLELSLPVALPVGTSILMIGRITGQTGVGHDPAGLSASR